MTYPTLMPVGMAGRQGVPLIASMNSQVLDATSEAVITYGYIRTTDGGSHTLNTTGLSSIGFRVNTGVHSSATPVTVGISTLDPASAETVPTATAVSHIITMSAQRTYTTTLGTANWIEAVPTSGTVTIANGDLIAVCWQMGTRAGTDAINLGAAATASGTGVFPGTTLYQSGAYTNGVRLPNVTIVFADGQRGYFDGSFVCTVGTATTTWNNTSAQKEYGNILQFPTAMDIHGAAFSIIVGTAAFDVNVYIDPFAASGGPTPVLTKSIDPDNMSMATIGPAQIMFPAPYTLPADTPCAVVLRPTTATDLATQYLTLNSSTHQEFYSPNGYAVSRGTVGTGTIFVNINSAKDRYAIGLIVSPSAAAPSGGGVMGSRIKLGM